MTCESFHIPDHELLAAADGELPAARLKKIRKHLDSCWTCRARMHEIENTIVEFIQAHQESFNAPDSSGPRALLQARLREAASDHPTAWQGILADLAAGSRRLFAGKYAMACITAATVAVIALLALPMIRSGRPQDARLARIKKGAIPDPRITPGAALPITREQACAVRAADRSPEVPRAAALRIFQQYGISDPRPRSYELDYLITPELGGSGDARNLWPQPYQAVSWNAHAKDALEDHLHQMVCDGTLDIESAQRDIASDWIAAYKKYFRTDEPLAMHASFLKDRPFE